MNWSLPVAVKLSYAGVTNVPELLYNQPKLLYTTLGLALHPLAHRHPLNTTQNLGAKLVGTVLGTV